MVFFIYIDPAGTTLHKNRKTLSRFLPDRDASAT